MGGRSVGERAVKDKRRKRLKIPFNQWNKAHDTKILDYPKCVSAMKDCPQTIEDPHNPPDTCRICPRYMESKFCHGRNQEERAKELAELFKHFGKGQA